MLTVIIWSVLEFDKLNYLEKRPFTVTVHYPIPSVAGKGNFFSLFEWPIPVG